MHKNARRGFTLVEMLIYTAILAGISILVVQGMYVVTKSFTALRVSRDINSSGTILLERLTREIRSAYDVDTTSSTLGSSPGRLTLNTKDSSGSNTTVEFYVEDNMVKIKEGGVAQGAVTTANTEVTNFVLREIVGANSKAIKVEVTLSETRAGTTQARNFYSTVLLRQ